MKKSKKIQGKYNFVILEKKIDRLINLVAVGITYGKELKDQAKFLSYAGFKPAEMTKVLNTTANSIRVTLARYKNK